MHPYATDSPRRSQVFAALIVVSIPITIGVNSFLEVNQITIEWYLEGPSLFLIYGILWLIFDRWLWRAVCRIHPNLLQIPDLNGKWNGIVHSSYDEFADDHPIEVTIKQTWSLISIRLQANLSCSQSSTASILTQAAGACILNYTYLNEPKAKAVGTQIMHRGTAILELTSEGTMEGQYYNSRGRATHGDIRIEKASSFP